MDLIAIDIQRERDLGIGSLNQTREALGLTPYTDFDQISSDPTVVANLQKVFSSVADVDLFIGGLAEDHAPGAMVGETFQKIIAQQFTNLRDGDRLWWQNQGFDDATAQQIQNTTLGDIETRINDTTVIQPDVFTPLNGTPAMWLPKTRKARNWSSASMTMVLRFPAARQTTRSSPASDRTR